MNKTDKFLFISILFLLILEAILFFGANNEAKKNLKEQQIQRQELKNQNLLYDLKLEAKAVSVYDFSEQKEIFGNNQYEVLPIASLVKTLTILVVLDEYLPNDEIVISENTLKEFSENNGLVSNEIWKVADLAKFSLILSSNVGAKNLANNINNFLEKINFKAKEIGMSNFSFLNGTGLDLNEKTSGAYASAFDVNKMNIYALRKYPEIFSATTIKELKIESNSKVIHDIKNTNLIINKIPNLLFSKTGLTYLAGGNLSIIFRNKENHIIAITLLGSTSEGRFSDMEKLVLIAYNLKNDE